MLANLKLLRSEAKISQKNLAEAVGTSQQSINKYENHSIEPDIAMLCKFADYFNVSVDFIIGRTHIRQLNTGIEESCLNDEEAGLIQLYRNLSPPVRKDFYNLMRHYSNQENP